MGFALIKRIFSDRGLSQHGQFERISYSQSGEDLIIDYIFRRRKISNPSYLDLGANHPFSINNTFLFYQRGARGINIDANPASVKLFEQFRPLDINVNIGVGVSPGKQDFFILNDPALSTFSEHEANIQKMNGKFIVKTLPVQVKTVNSIIEDYCGGVFPDFINIDLEGLDESIFSSINFEKSKPKVICLETVEYTVDGTGKKNEQLIRMVVEAGYSVYADTNINTIFVENKFWFNASSA
jgi:hypothetical protein